MSTITAGQTYLTRSGKTVQIYDINPNEHVSFRARGYILRVDKLGRVYRKYSVWKLDGRFMAVGEHGLDIL